MADFGPVGGGLAAVTGVAPLIIETQAAHGLADGDRVSIGMPDGVPTPLCYAQCAGLPANAFAAYADAKFANAAALPVLAVGTPIVNLAKEDYAVVAGINGYPSFTSLQGPVGDATRFQQWLLTGAFVPSDQISLIVSSKQPPANPVNAQPTLDQVKAAFEALAGQAVTKDLFRLGRRLYIFLSGHGIMPTRSGAPSFNETALLMANAGPITLGNHLGGFSYAEWFRAPGVFDEIILFVDCCRDQKDAVALTPPSMQTLVPQRPPARYFYAAATQLASPSFEKLLGNPAEVRGVFSFALMQALQSQSLCDPNGVLTGNVLASQLFSAVPALQNGQDPDIDYKPHQDIVIVKRLTPTKPKASITFAAPDLIGKTARLIGKNYPMPDATHVVANLAWSVQLDPFHYILDVPGSPYAKKLFELDGQQEVQNVVFP
jgi:hypothetical protein